MTKDQKQLLKPERKRKKKTVNFSINVINLGVKGFTLFLSLAKLRE